MKAVKLALRRFSAVGSAFLQATCVASLEASYVNDPARLRPLTAVSGGSQSAALTKISGLER
ncbi:putative secreted protein (plasmid) [Rhizobium favelukesii]|uniref:Secreted protein n=1 Tax=Rhizobium favelukesii TaxID=348824 RepID=W6RIR2_9HYPH|nr:putative secreted protein [Rhizobium favelukesii]